MTNDLSDPPKSTGWVKEKGTQIFRGMLPVFGFFSKIRKKEKKRFSPSLIRRWT